MLHKSYIKLRYFLNLMNQKLSFLSSTIVSATNKNKRKNGNWNLWRLTEWLTDLEKTFAGETSNWRQHLPRADTSREEIEDTKTRTDQKTRRCQLVLPISSTGIASLWANSPFNLQLHKSRSSGMAFRHSGSQQFGPAFVGSGLLTHSTWIFFVRLTKVFKRCLVWVG